MPTMEVAGTVISNAPAPIPLWRLLVDAAVFGIVGIVLLIIGY
jgi:hypothetical protein